MSFNFYVATIAANWLITVILTVIMQYRITYTPCLESRLMSTSSELAVVNSTWICKNFNFGMPYTLPDWRQTVANDIMRRLQQSFPALPMLLLLLGFNNCSPLEHSDPTELQLNDWLTLATANLPDLVLLLRRHSVQKDAAHFYMQWFLRRSKRSFSVTLLSYDANTALSGNRDNYVIVSDLDHFADVARRFVQRAGVFFWILPDVVMSAHNVSAYSETLHASCAHMWQRYKVYKNFLLTQTGVWIYDPFEFVPARGGYGKIVRYMGDISLERKLFNDMRGYPLRTQIFKSVYARPKFDEVTKRFVTMTGPDVLAAQAVRERLNFTMILQDPDPHYFGEITENGTYNGAIGSILRDGLDLCFTGFFIKDYMVSDYMDFTVAVYDDELCIYVPKAKPIPQSILPIFAVGYDIWLGFIFTANACACFWMLLRAINLYLGILRRQGKRLWYQILRIFNDTWVVWVRVNIVRLPVSYAERIFIASLCLVSVIFGAIFESSLATVYIHPLYYKDINTLHELDQSGLKVIYKYTSMAVDLFFSETSKVFANLNKKLVWNSDLNADITLEIAETGGKASVTRRTSLMLESAHFTISNRIWVVPECPKYYALAYVMPKDSPWDEAVNAVLLNLLKGGIIDKWISDRHSTVDIKTHSKLLLEYNNDTKFRVLTINDLQLAFYVALGGNLLAFCIFLCERFLWRRVKAWRRRRANK